MNQVKPRTLSGFMELLPQQQLYFEKMLSVIRDTYENHGFFPLDTPIIEASEVLLAKGGGETEKQIYRFEKGDTDLSLRFDLTVPLAKYVAMNQGQLTFPFRRYQIGKVYRGERAQRGRFREFYQADIDIIGSESLAVENDGEMVLLISKVFAKLGLEGYTIHINNRKILTGFYEMLGLADKSGDIMRVVDKLEKIGKEKVLELLVEEGVSVGQEILDFMELSQEPKEAFWEKLKSYEGKNPTFDLGVKELAQVCDYLNATLPEKLLNTVDVNLSIARGLDYYTGTVYETTLNDHPEIGSICSGGRYDNLAEYYTNKKLPGVGISIGLTRLFYIMEEKGYLNPLLLSAPCDVLFLPMSNEKEYMERIRSTMDHCREEIRYQIYTENKKMKQKFAYADKLGIPYVVIIGEEELEDKESILVKDMKTGEQNKVHYATLGEVLAYSPKSPFYKPEEIDHDVYDPYAFEPNVNKRRNHPPFSMRKLENKEEKK
ncbi:MAG: histidine--tRNA ligase [Eubacteriales bacterium]